MPNKLIVLNSTYIIWGCQTWQIYDKLTIFPYKQTQVVHILNLTLSIELKG